MVFQLNHSVKASMLASAIGEQMIGPDAIISNIATLSSAVSGSLVFTKIPQSSVPPGVVLIGAEQLAGTSCIVATNPRLAFAKASQFLVRTIGLDRYKSPPQIAATASIGKNVTVGNGSTIGHDTVVLDNVVIAEGVQIGDRCIIKSGSIIGQDGFGFERDDDGNPHRIPHLGAVQIGNDVEIGSVNTVCRGTLSDTVIEAFVKTDDHVHIAHNVHIERAVLICACAEISGSVRIGAFSWIGPNASIIQKVVIGDHSFIGIAANVTKDVEAGATVAGNPARVLRS